MLTDRIQEKLRELSSLPTVTSVGLGKKIIGGNETDTLSITFGVSVKQTNPEYMLPTSVDIDGVTYVTDVIQVGEISPAACPINPDNSFPEYIQSGMYLSNEYFINVRGRAKSPIDPYTITTTLGFVAYHTERQALVGITSGHLLYDITEATADNKGARWNQTFMSGAPYFGATEGYDYSLNNSFYSGVYDDGSYNIVALPFYYKPLKVKAVSDPDRFNQIDASVITFAPYYYTQLIQDTTGTSIQLYPGFNPGWKSYNVKGIPEITSPMPFATTAELNALITSPPFEVASSGAGTGPKRGINCGLKITGIGQTTNFTYSTMPGPIYFDNLISFTRIDPADTAVALGDSGAAIVARFGAAWKIVGLVVGGNASIGYACRIDKIAEQLGIEAWDGSLKRVVSLVYSSFAPYATLPGLHTEHIINLNNRKYYQTGTIVKQPIHKYE